MKLPRQQNSLRGQDLKNLKLPDAPGVYFFKRGRDTLYVGKATSLRDRVRSYFPADLIETRGPRIVDMVAKASGVRFQQTDSVLEALLLEAELIQKLKPPYNTDGKDDKSFNCVIITDEDFPRILVLRQKDLSFSQLRIKPARRLAGGDKGLKIRAIHGPFPHGAELREALKIIRRIFPYRDTCIPCPHPRSRASNVRPSAGCKPCFNRQIGLCPGVCTGEISRREYSRTVHWMQLFFEGKKRSIVKNLARDMQRLAKIEAFEEANEMKRKIFTLNHIHDISLLRTSDFQHMASHFRIEAYDVSHFGGKEIVGVMAVVEDGVPAKEEHRTFHIKNAKGGDDAEALREVLTRRLRHSEWRMPDLIVVDGGKQQLQAVASAVKVSPAFLYSISLVSVVKDERHKPREILGNRKAAREHERAILLANSEAHRFALSFHRRARRKSFL